MLTKEENQLLCGVEAGTPLGDLLRRYWWPLAPKAEIDEKRIRALQLLGEDLVLFRDGQGQDGLLAEHCSHSGVSLSYGRIEDDALRFFYHGSEYAALWQLPEIAAVPIFARHP